MRSEKNSLEGFVGGLRKLFLFPFRSLIRLIIRIFLTQELLTESLVNECAATGSNVICSAADNYCVDNVESIYDEVLNRDEYDIRELEPDP